jgi:MoaA/NifB/PqqE/SkfB family radical SAM enzyme
MAKPIRCVHIENGLKIENTGQVMSCCQQQSYFEDVNAKNNTFLEIKNSLTRKKYIKEFSEGKKPAACNHCWNEEAAGYKSKRIIDNKKFSETQVSVDKNCFPAILDISMGTQCNLKCRTCGAFNSSTWNKEWFDLGYFQGSKQDFKEYVHDINDSFNDDSIFWQEFENNLHEINHIDFYGGEPFLVKKQWKMLKKAIEKNLSHKISVHYNTNGTTWDSTKEHILQKFKKVYIDLSIDAIGDKFNYIRHPGNWNQTLNNFLFAKKFADNNQNVEVNICTTVSILNVLYLNELETFFNSYDTDVYYIMVHEPEYYNIKNLPNFAKEKVKEKLKSHPKQDFFIEKIIKFMFSRSSSDDNIKQFFRITRLHDSYRQESFEKVFPEMEELLKGL